MAQEIINGNLDDIELKEKSKKIESMKKFKIKDYEAALHHLTTEELNLYKNNAGGIINQKDIDVLETGKKIIEQVKEIRRERNRKTSKVDTNILTASPFFVGGNKKMKEKGKEQGYITFEQGGIRKLTYHNDLGLLLTYNDAKTLFSLFALWEEQGKEEWLSFTEYQLLEKMNMGTGGRQYQIIRDSMEKIRNTSVVLQEAYDIKSGKRYITERFSLIIADKFTLETDETGRVRSKLYEIQFSPHIYKSMMVDGYYSLISLALWDELETDAAKAIYSMISGISNMDGNDNYIKKSGEYYEIPLGEVYNHLKLEHPKPFRNKLVVEAACNELKQVEIINGFHFTGLNNKATAIVIEPSKWLMDIMTKSLNKEVVVAMRQEITS